MTTIPSGGSSHWTRSPCQRRLYIEAYWNKTKFCWARHAVVANKSSNPADPQRRVDNWYWLCQKVRAVKRRERKATAAQIQAERPEKNKAEVRVTLHARILSLVDQFAADVQGPSDEERARFMSEMKIRSSPPWAPTEIATHSLRGSELTAISPGGPRRLATPWRTYIYAIKERHGWCSCPHCLNPCRP